MLRRSLPWLLCLPALTACPGDSLEDFSRRALRAQVERGGEGEQPLFSARLDRLEPEEGCPRLRSSAKATLNGEPLQVMRGQEEPDGDLPCFELPTFALRLDRARFAGEPEDAVLEIQDGDERIVARYRNLFGRHGLARGASPQVVKPGQEVFLAWDPPTDDLSLVEVVFYGESFVQARPEAGGLRVTFPADLPAGPLKVRAPGLPLAPVVRCEGVRSCSAVGDLVSPEEEEVEVLIQP